MNFFCNLLNMLVMDLIFASGVLSNVEYIFILENV
jgi:hypothetical protein